VKARASLLLILAGACTIAMLSTSDAAQNSSNSVRVAARIKCQGEDSVNVTADAEQGLPLQLVDVATCGEPITVLSDPQAYTVKVRTSSGKVGWVTRFEVLIDPSAPAPPQSTPIIIVGSAHAQAQTPVQTSVQPSTQLLNKPATPGVAPDNGPHKPRVYISDTQSWNEIGGFSNSPTGQTPLYAGYNPEMPDIYQDFTSGCPAIVVTQDKTQAEYAILFDKGSTKKGVKGLGGLVKVNKFTVLSRSGETLLSDESHSEDTAVKMACGAIAQKIGTTSPSPAPK
jgi:hypothetical protein